MARLGQNDGNLAARRRMSIRSWMRLTGMLAAVALFLALPLPALAQNCALCYTQRAAAGAGVIQALRSGILILIIPPTLGTVGLFFVIHRRINQFRLADDAAEPGQDW
jgi:hypothetical protein